MAWRRCIDLAPNHYKYRLIFDLKNTFIEKDLPMQCCQTNVVGCTSFDTLNNRLKELTINIWEVAIIQKAEAIYLNADAINLIADGTYLNTEAIYLNEYDIILNAEAIYLNEYDIILNAEVIYLNFYDIILNDVARNLNGVGNF